MRVLGLSASVALAQEDIFNQLGVSGSGHDSAAVLIEDGKVIAAIEQERLDRIKHSNKSPIEAIRYCMKESNITINDIDYIAINYRQASINFNLQERFLDNKTEPIYNDLKYYVHRMLKNAFGEPVDDKKIIFVSHNESHAESAYAMSGFEDCLVFVTDGVGDDSAGFIQSRRDGKIEVLHIIPVSQSLGNFYINSIRYLGYEANDEYKVMGLAPYGNPRKYQFYFNKIAKLLPDGQYEINPNMYPILFDINRPRRKGEPFTKIHQDIAAGIQQKLEDIILHMLKYYQAQTKHTKLCMAGGVAHNCSANGKILYEHLFDEVFVQPAAHDAGSVLGAALYVYNKKNVITFSNKQMEEVYWGPKIGNDDEIKKHLNQWSSFLNFEESKNIVSDTADLLAKGKIVGWVQGRSEFGPRALGNRSILADPRPEENKHIINQMVKKREGYRPFAPSVQLEYLEEYFHVPPTKAQYSFMNFVLDVNKDKRELLGAITHVDGTARIQTVKKETNPLYWNLIDAFAKRTGVHILLNTSFNNNAEPIVDSIEDAIVCYLTTKLHYLVIGNYIISKKPFDVQEYLNLKVTRPTYVRLNECNQFISEDEMQDQYFISVTYDKKLQIPVSRQCFKVLKNATGEQSLSELIQYYELNSSDAMEKLIREFVELWEKRVITLHP